MPVPLGDIGRDTFLKRYWQREPLLIRQAFPGFDPLLDGDDLAGLACDPLAESRLVSGTMAEANWTLRHGPFTASDFQALDDCNWTLLVTDVEKHYPPLLSLFDRFDFLPRWRLDDLMVSFAAPGGSVGPHVDQYDVFLLQAEGHRRWEISRAFDPKTLPDLELDVLAGFIPEDAWTLAPGDMLYLPPGVAHHGVAVDPGLTYSIGFRAPSTADLMLAMGEALAEMPGEGGRYTDPMGAPPADPGELSQATLERLRSQLLQALASRDIVQPVLTRFLSTFRLAHTPAPPPKTHTWPTLEHALNAGARLSVNPWTRLLWIEQDGAALLFAAGDAVRCTRSLAVGLCGEQLSPRATATLGDADRSALVELLNAGHLFLADAPSCSADKS